jgi:hypothetical protein
MKADAYIVREIDSNGETVWCSLMFTRPTELSWFRDLPTKKHTLVIEELFIDSSKTETFNGIKSYKESTQRLIEANQGL